MNNNGRTLLGSAITALLAAGPASNAAAQGTQAAQLEEIVVTARRREETLQDLPLSIAVVSANDLQTQSIYTSDQVAELVPNLTLKESTPGSSLVYIRGIGGGHSDPSYSFGAGMYVDGHYIPFARGGYMSTLDIDRIEVLRGPQGTLFGKNTTGGAVNIISTKPQPEFDSSLTARLGDYGQQDLRGMINIPISDNVFARISAASEQSDGYYYNITKQRDSGLRDMTAWRAALRFTPGNWTIDAVLGDEKTDNDDRQTSCAPDPAGAVPFAGIWGDPGQTQVYAICAEAAARGPWTDTTDMPTYTNFDTENASLTAEWDSGGPVGGLENLVVRTQYSWRHMQNEWFQEIDHTPFPVGYIKIDSGNGTGTLSENTSFEVLIEGDVNDRLNFLAGVWSYDNLTDDAQGYDCRNYFLDNHVPGDPNESLDCPEPYKNLGPFLGLVPTGPPGFFISSYAIQSVLDEQSKAVFGHITYAINDLWDFEFGVRYTKDDRDWYNWQTQASNVVQTPGVYPATWDTIMSVQTLCNFEDPTQPGSNGWCGQDKKSWSATSPKLSFTRSVDGVGSIENGNIYFLYSEGYLTGAFNSERPAGTEPFWVVEPEYVNNYEAGFKGVFTDGRVSLNADVFYMDYQDKQVNITIDNSNGQFGGAQDSYNVTTNAATAAIYGIELEMAALPWDGGSLSVGLGYLKNEYGNFDSFDPALGTDVDMSAVTIRDLSPDWTLNVSLEHTFQLGNGGSITPMLGMYWQSEYDWQSPTDLAADTHEGFCKQDAYSKWRARLSYETPGGQYRVSLFGRNITDQEIIANCNYSFGVALKTLEAPAMWGIEFTGRWGNN